MSTRVRKQLLQLPDISKIDVLGAQDERIYVEFSAEQLAGPRESTAPR
jgi:multidrug efflux pump subunit AcrB